MADGAEEHRAARLAFGRWKRRFVASARRPCERHEEILFLCQPAYAEPPYAEEWPEWGNKDGPQFIQPEIDRKVAFMRAYIDYMFVDGPSPVHEVERLLACQERDRAPHVLGFWFSQMDPAMFGPGSRSDFSACYINLFCEAVEQIDIADVSRLMPFDRVMVRRPGRVWTEADAEAMGEHIKSDLAFDGDDTELKIWLDGEFCSYDLLTPDYGF